MNYVNYYKIDLQQFLYLLIICSIFFYISKYSKYSSAEYYLNDKERIQKKACKRYQSLFKEEEKATKWLWLTQKSARRLIKSLLSIKKSIINKKKKPCYNDKELFWWKRNKLENSFAQEHKDVLKTNFETTDLPQ